MKTYQLAIALLAGAACSSQGNNKDTAGSGGIPPGGGGSGDDGSGGTASPDDGGSADGQDDADGTAVRDLIGGALRKEPAERPVDVLAGVQRKLRERSGGKFYGDAWSTARQAPTLTFLVTGALMLVVIVVTYALLAPLRGKPERVRTEPAPVDVIAPAPPPRAPAQ